MIHQSLPMSIGHRQNQIGKLNQVRCNGLAAMVINIITAGLAGVAVPVAFDRLDQDPAVASSVFVTMITDSMGFFAFLGLAVASGVVN